MNKDYNNYIIMCYLEYYGKAKNEFGEMNSVVLVTHK